MKCVETMFTIFASLNEKEGSRKVFSLGKQQLWCLFSLSVVSSPHHQGRAGAVPFFCKVPGWFASWSAAAEAAVRPCPLQRSYLDTHPCQGAFTSWNIVELGQKNENRNRKKFSKSSKVEAEKGKEQSMQAKGNAEKRGYLEKDLRTGEGFTRPWTSSQPPHLPPHCLNLMWCSWFSRGASQILLPLVSVLPESWASSLWPWDMIGSSETRRRVRVSSKNGRGLSEQMKSSSSTGNKSTE